MVGTRVGRYRVLSLLGQGGMATVWKAEDTLLGRTVALKILADDLARQAEPRRRFLREARIAARLDHPGIAAVHDAGRDGETIYIALSCIEGQTLSERLARGPMPLEEAARIVLAAAEALAYAHESRVVHRDVTSRNIMIAGDGRVFVLDFGIALAADNTRVTSSSVTLGTAAFIAPEIVRREPADARTDLYGLGVVLYEALTGTLPFRGARPEVVLYAVVNEDPAPPGALRSGIPERVAGVVLKAMSKSPDRRHQSAAEFIADLRSALADARADSGPAEETAEANPTPSRGSGGEAWRRPDQRYLVVLPFEDDGTTGTGREGREVFGGGLAEALTASLAGLPGLELIPPPPAAACDDGDLPTLARRLGANLVLRGVVRHAGAQLRISYSLVAPFESVQLAGGVLDGTRAALFDLEDRLISEVRSALDAGAAEEPSGAARRPRDPAARERYVQALGYLRHHENEAALDGAIGLLERLLASEGDSVPVHAALGRAYLGKYRLTREHRWESKAAAACARAVELDPQAPDALVTLGDVHAAVGRLEDAVRDYGRALEVRRDLPEAHLGLAQAYEGLGRHAEALEVCRECIRRWPNDWRGHNRLGLLHYNRGRFERAAEAWGAVVRVAPESTRGYLNLGAALFQLDRLDEATDAFRRSIELQPTASALTSLGSVLFFLGRHAEALEALEKGPRLRPSDPEVWGHLGSAYRWTPGMEERAAAPLERAIELIRDRLARNPTEAGDWALLGSWLASRKRRDEALPALERALALAPGNPRLMAEIGTTFEGLGCRERAVQLLRGALRAGHPPGHLKREPTLAALRRDPDWKSILEEAPAQAGDVQP